ncbi:hypothetical protein EOA35_34600, partial [Mesorhizobium sp. M8A.F.Ca.ET.023.01.1.1]
MDRDAASPVWHDSRSWHTSPSAQEGGGGGHAGHTKLVHLSRTSLLGELSGAFAHELNQPLTSILANAEVGKQLLESSDPSLTEVSDILSDIIADDERAAEIIRQLRRLLTRHEVALEP